MKMIDGDILDIDDGIIIHQANCMKLAGTGIALQIRNKFPEFYRDLQNDKPALGNVLLTFPATAPKLTIISIYSQLSVGRHTPQTNYESFAECLLKVAAFAAQKKKQVYIPYRIGCGAGGGNWDKVSALINELLPTAIIVKLPNITVQQPEIVEKKKISRRTVKKEKKK